MKSGKDGMLIMEYEKIKQLIEDFGNSKLTSINLDFPDGMKINMQKNDNEVVKIKSEPIVEKVEVVKTDIEDKTCIDGNVIKSPMVGTFYMKPSPNAEPYVSVGKNVSKGDVVCIIEAMKLMNEIESEFDGVVKEVYVKDGEAVEYGTPLFRLS